MEEHVTKEMVEGKAQRLEVLESACQHYCSEKHRIKALEPFRIALENLQAAYEAAQEIGYLTPDELSGSEGHLWWVAKQVLENGDATPEEIEERWFQKYRISYDEIMGRNW